jgi:hypothetical protein
MAAHANQSDIGSEPQIASIKGSVEYGSQLSSRIEIVAKHIIAYYLVDTSVESQPDIPAGVGGNGEYRIVLQYIACMKMVPEPPLLVDNI